MKLLPNAVLLLATAFSAAALPAPATEAEIDALRAQGLTEQAIAARFPHAHHTATLLRRAIDADGEVAPGAFSAPPPPLTMRFIEAHAGLDEDSAEGMAVSKHVNAVKDFINAVLSGKMATAGNGGVAMRKGKRGDVVEGAVMEGQERGQAEMQQRPGKWIYHW